MIQAIPFLTFASCNEVIPFYQKLFDAKVTKQVFAKKEMFPQGVNLDFDSFTMHAELDIQGATISMCDKMPNTPENPSSNKVSVYLKIDSDKFADDVFKKAQESKCFIIVPLARQIWGYYCLFVDPHGIMWHISHEAQYTPN